MAMSSNTIRPGAPRRHEVYRHRLFSNVIAEVVYAREAVEGVEGGGFVEFVRRNTDSQIRTPSSWPFERFQKFFYWGAAPKPGGRDLRWM